MASSSASDVLTASLDALPRVRLIPGPTPVQRLDRLRAHLGGPQRGVPTLLVKRDDLNGVAYGGNKLRKLSGWPRTRRRRARTCC